MLNNGNISKKNNYISDKRHCIDCFPKILLYITMNYVQILLVNNSKVSVFFVFCPTKKKKMLVDTSAGGQERMCQSDLSHTKHN